MDISQLNLKSNVLASLNEAHYITIDQLATAGIDRLAKLPGIGKATAKNIVNQAQAIVNRQRLEESQFLQGHEETPPPVVKMSARVQRIQAQKEAGE